MTAPVEALARLAEVDRLVAGARAVRGRVLLDRAALLDRLGALRSALEQAAGPPGPASGAPLETAGALAERALAELEAVLQRVASAVARAPRPADPEAGSALAELTGVLHRSLESVSGARRRLAAEGSPLGGGLHGAFDD